MATSPKLSRHNFHARALRAAVNRLPARTGIDQRTGRSRRTWLCTVELDLQPHNLGLNSAWQRVQDCTVASDRGDGYTLPRRATDNDDDDDDGWMPSYRPVKTLKG